MSTKVRSAPTLHSDFADPRIKRLYEKLETVYRDVDLPAHGWDHIQRVLKNALDIAATMSCRLDIVIPSALLHDIGFVYENDPYKHHELGAAKSVEWTSEWSTEEQIIIAECIRRHKGNVKGFGILPETAEQKIVCDADLLEKVGYIGVVQGIRTFVEFGESCCPQYQSLFEIVDHLAGLRKLVFYTEEGRGLAEGRGGVALRAEIYAKAREELRPYYR